MSRRGAFLSLAVVILSGGCDGCGNASSSPRTEDGATAAVAPADTPGIPNPTIQPPNPNPDPESAPESTVEPTEVGVNLPDVGEDGEPKLWQNTEAVAQSSDDGASYSVWRERAAKEIDADNARAQLNRLEKQINLEREKLKKEARR